MSMMDRLHRIPRRLLAVGVSLAALTSAVASCGADAGRSETESRVLFAYASSTAIGLVSNANVVAQAQGNFDAPRSTMFTSDGKYVVALSTEQRKLSLKAIEVDGGRIKTIPVSFDRFSVGSGSTIVWLESPNRLMGLDLRDDNPQPTLVRSIELPPLPDGDIPTAPQLVAAADSTVLLSRWEDRTSGPGPQNLYLVDKTGKVRSLGRMNSSTPIGYAYYSPNGKLIAYTNDSRYCENTTVSVIDTEQGAIQTVNPPHSSEPARLVSRGIWWQPDGTLSAVFKGVPCREQSSETVGMRDTAFKLSNGAWEEISDERVTQVLIFGKDKTASIASNDGNGGDLTLELSGKKSNIAQKVQHLLAPPANRSGN
ncbi:hypothetical protein [Mycobacteroides franklinii]|uniref:hypothetical protein n=1 Tax=Mycobacteroides franklinii TaxID=948102 RepID=UPI001E5745BF|nr:hypothetical protein [Mycobacteroides franklinii]